MMAKTKSIKNKCCKNTREGTRPLLLRRFDGRCPRSRVFGSGSVDVPSRVLRERHAPGTSGLSIRSFTAGVEGDASGFAPILAFVVSSTAGATAPSIADVPGCGISDISRTDPGSDDTKEHRRDSGAVSDETRARSPDASRRVF